MNKLLLFCFLMLFALLTIGCGKSTESLRKQETQPPGNREKALQYYIEGSLFDQKGDYARAVIEYQEALRYDDDPAIYHALSINYSRLGKHYSAVTMGQEAVKRSPENRTYRQSLAEAYTNAFEIDKAIAEYEQLLQLDSSVTTVWFNLARLMQLKKPLKALETYRMMIERFGPNWDVYTSMAELYSAFGKFDSVANVLGELLAIDPGNYEVEKSLAEALLRSDKPDTARSIYEDLLSRNPADLEVRAALTHVYLADRDYERAATQVRHVLESDTLSVETQLRFGQLFASSLQKDSTSAPFAYEIFQSVRKNYPQDWRPHWFLGVIANVMKSDSLAISHFREVTRLAPDNSDGWVNLGSMFLERGEVGNAISILEEGKSKAGEDFRILFLLGVSLQRSQRHTDAIPLLENAVKLNSRDVNALSALALSYEELKRHEDSDRIYEEALKVDPSNHLLLNNFGYSLAERGIQLDRSLRMATEAVSQQPENSSYLDTIGWVYFKLGQYVEAEMYIRKAIEKSESSSVILEHLGDVYAKTGKKEQAIEYWRKALERDPSNQNAKEKIERGGL